MGPAVTKIAIRYIQAYTDRIGKARYYFRRKGFPKVTLPGLPGSNEFMEAYRRALDGAPAAKKHPARPFISGSVDALVSQFYGSAQWAALRPSSQRIYRGILEPFRQEHGDKPVSLLERKHVQEMIAERASKPHSANAFKGLLRNLMGFAVDNGYRTDNPLVGMKRLKTNRDGFHTWTDDEIAAFEKHWPVGSKPRLAFALHLYTGQRRSDVLKMTWGHIERGRIRVTQVKTGATLRIPIHPELQRVLDAAPRDHVAILGAPMHPNSYCIWFRRVADAAGLPMRCASHGLRKAAARRLAEAGCTVLEIASVTGHASLAEVQRYTREADRDRLAEQAITKIRHFGAKSLETQ
jgi:integrase